MSMYQHDYLVASALKDPADAHGVALVVVHHDRKAKSEDYVDDASWESWADRRGRHDHRAGPPPR